MEKAGWMGVVVARVRDRRRREGGLTGSRYLGLSGWGEKVRVLSGGV